MTTEERAIFRLRNAVWLSVGWIKGDAIRRGEREPKVVRELRGILGDVEASLGLGKVNARPQAGEGLRWPGNANARHS